MPLVEHLEPRLRTGALAISQRLKDHGFEAYFAGGVVRDLLLKRPVSDVDIATSAPPKAVEGLFDHTFAVGRAFGVLIVVIDDINYEVATFRRDGGYFDGRRPVQVEFSGPREDALRRDFTINALFLDPADDRIVDFAGGLRDLKARLIRTVGTTSQRFAEDKLRLLRAVRFACNLGFEIDPETWEGVCAQASTIRQVSWERIRDEVVKILTGPAARRGLRLLDASGLLKETLPEVSALKGIEQPPEFHPEGDVFVHTSLLFEHAQPVPDADLALGMLLHDVGKPATMTRSDRIRFHGHAEVGAQMSDDICRRLRLSNRQRQQVVDLVGQHMRFMHVREMRPSTLKRFLRQDNIEKHLLLHRADCLASHGQLDNYLFCREKLEEMAREPQPPTPLIGGADLIAMGFEPGPLFSVILKAVEDRQLEGRLAERQEALEWVRRRWPLDDPN